MKLEQLPDRPLRVLWVVKALGLGGAEQLLLNAARVHDPRRVALTCAYVIGQEPDFVASMATAGVELVLIGERGRRVGWVRSLGRLLKERRFDVVHLHSPLPASVARMLIRLIPARGRPVVVTTEHNQWPSFHPLTRWANRFTIRGDDLVVAVSDAVRMSMIGRTKERCIVLRHGVDAARLRASATERPASSSFRGKDDRPVLLSVANYRRNKDHSTLLRAVDRLRARGVLVRCLLVGSGPLESEIRQMTAELDLVGEVELLGRRDDVPSLMAVSDLFVMSSAFEGLPVALMESLAMGLPIVATEVGGIREALEGTGAAIIVPAGSPERLASAIDAVLGDRRLRERMAHHARDLSPKFDISETARWIEDTYDRLVLERSRSYPRGGGTDPSNRLL